MMSVMTKGQKPHARLPSSANQRQPARIEHRGNSPCAGETVARSKRSPIRPHFVPCQYLHDDSAHVLLNRNRLSGARPSRAVCVNSASTKMRSLNFVVLCSGVNERNCRLEPPWLQRKRIVKPRHYCKSATSGPLFASPLGTWMGAKCCGVVPHSFLNSRHRCALSANPSLSATALFDQPSAIKCCAV